MQTHDLIQGSPAWCQFRLDHHGASEAAAMLGVSPKTTRTELLHMKHTGLAKEFSDWVQKNILDRGHAVEARARPLVEAIIGDDLYPVTCSDGKLSASLDGLTMGEDIAFEHKQNNAALANAVAAGDLPTEYMPQCQQILMVTGASKLIFVVSDGTSDCLAYMWVLPNQHWFERIRTGWEQFDKDLAAYEPRDVAEKPQAVSIMQLPALAIQIRGEVTLSNLPQFKAAAKQFIAQINTDLKTDADFADAEATVKFCEKAEKDLELTKSAAIAQTASIDELMRTIDFIQSELRSKRLTLDKLVKTQKEVIKISILNEAKLAFFEHVRVLQAEIAPITINHQMPDFAGAMKNKRTLASLHDAVDSALANGKIAIDAQAQAIRGRLTWYRTAAEGVAFLFHDLQQIIQKADDDFQMLVNGRITEHKAKEAARMNVERARIQVEERIKAEAAAVAAKKRAEVEHAAAELASAKQAPEGRALSPAAQVLNEADGAARFAIHHPSIAAKLNPAAAWPMPTRAPNLRLGQISERLGFAVTADFLRSLGFEPAGREKSAVLFHDAQFPLICDALIAHIQNACQLQAA